MKKSLANTLSIIVASLFIIIGLLHTEVHFRELTVPSVESKLAIITDIQLLGKQADMWKLWQGFSFMMGVCFIVIGIAKV